MDRGARSYTGNNSLLVAKYLDVQQSIAELTQQLVSFIEPDAGMEPV